MNTNTLTFIQAALEHLGEATGALYWTNADEVEAHLAKAAVAISDASKALKGRGSHEPDRVGSLRP